MIAVSYLWINIIKASSDKYEILKLVFNKGSEKFGTLDGRHFKSR